MASYRQPHTYNASWFEGYSKPNDGRAEQHVNPSELAA